MEEQNTGTENTGQIMIDNAEQLGYNEAVMKHRNRTRPYETNEDFKMRLRVMMGRPAIVSNAYRVPAWCKGKRKPATTPKH